MFLNFVGYAAMPRMADATANGVEIGGPDKPLDRICAATLRIDPIAARHTAPPNSKVFDVARSRIRAPILGVART
jgi:hypothetical protein